MNKTVNPCVHCHYARMRTDICGVYCTGGFENPDGTCDRFRDSREALTDSVDHKKLIEALLCCVDRKCGECSYRGCGIACKYRLMREATAQLAAKDAENTGLKADLARVTAERDAAKSTAQSMAEYLAGVDKDEDICRHVEGANMLGDCAEGRDCVECIVAFFGRTPAKQDEEG